MAEKSLAQTIMDKLFGQSYSGRIGPQAQTTDENGNSLESEAKDMAARKRSERDAWASLNEK